MTALLNVDGTGYRIDAAPDRSLLEVLRDELGLTAAKYGCGEAQCGACKVLIDGRAVPACTTPVSAALGHTVVTAAGLGTGGNLHPVQQAFLEIGAMQCGYCTPGMVIAAAALLAENPDPDDNAIRTGLDVNVCRCCAYPRILRAVHRAAELSANGSTTPAPESSVPTTLTRPARPWDLSDPGERDWFGVLPDGLVVVLPPEAVPPWAWSASGGAWIHVGVDGAVTAFTGKVEVGQDNRTMLSLLVAEELGVPLDRVTLMMGDTDVCPFDEGTFGSLSAPDAGPVLRAAAAAARALLDGGLPAPGTRRVEFVSADAPLSEPSSWRVAGSATPHVRAVDAVTGSKRFPSDTIRPGMLHGAILRPPAAGASLRSVNTSAASASPDVVVVRDGSAIGAVGPTPSAARTAVAAMRAEWDRTRQPSEADLAEYLRDHPVESRGWGGAVTEEVGDVDAALARAKVRLAATYTTAYVAHVSLEPRVAVAEWDAGRVTVWTGTQRPVGVRQEVSAALGIDEEDVRVMVPDAGSGFGGKHSGEVAIEAARLARAAGRPVKVAWTREEEFSWAYHRPASVIDVSSGATTTGKIRAWDFTNLNSGSAGIETPYAVPNRRFRHQPAASPLRQGSYRALAATANHFARESHMDELAHAVGADPVEFRLAHLGDNRLAEVLGSAALQAGWGQSGRALGIACGVEKDARVATCVEVSVDGGRLRVLRIVTAFDCGTVINPDNLVNQIEGATLMGLGGALFEAIHFEDGRILNGRLSEYRVPRFSDVPPIEVLLVDRPEEPPAGAGETPIVAVAPALANAIFAACGVRLRALPLAPDGTVGTPA